MCIESAKSRRRWPRPGRAGAGSLNLSNVLSKLQAIFAWDRGSGKQRIAQRLEFELGSMRLENVLAAHLI
jgi:hypothetical protein